MANPRRAVPEAGREQPIAHVGLEPLRGHVLHRGHEARGGRPLAGGATSFTLQAPQAVHPELFLVGTRPGEEGAQGDPLAKIPGEDLVCPPQEVTSPGVEDGINQGGRWRLRCRLSATPLGWQLPSGADANQGCTGCHDPGGEVVQVKQRREAAARLAGLAPAGATGPLQGLPKERDKARKPLVHNVAENPIAAHKVQLRQRVGRGRCALERARSTLNKGGQRPQVGERAKKAAHRRGVWAGRRRSHGETLAQVRIVACFVVSPRGSRRHGPPQSLFQRRHPTTRVVEPVARQLRLGQTCRPGVRPAMWRGGIALQVEQAALMQGADDAAGADWLKQEEAARLVADDTPANDTGESYRGIALGCHEASARGAFEPLVFGRRLEVSLPAADGEWYLTVWHPEAVHQLLLSTAPFGRRADTGRLHTSIWYVAPQPPSHEHEELRLQIRRRQRRAGAPRAPGGRERDTFLAATIVADAYLALDPEHNGQATIYKLPDMAGGNRGLSLTIKSLKEAPPTLVAASERAADRRREEHSREAVEARGLIYPWSPERAALARLARKRLLDAGYTAGSDLKGRAAEASDKWSRLWQTPAAAEKLQWPKSGEEWTQLQNICDKRRFVPMGSLHAPPEVFYAACCEAFTEAQRQQRNQSWLEAGWALAGLLARSDRRPAHLTQLCVLLQLRSAAARYRSDGQCSLGRRQTVVLEHFDSLASTPISLRECEGDDCDGLATSIVEMAAAVKAYTGNLAELRRAAELLRTVYHAAVLDVSCIDPGSRKRTGHASACLLRQELFESGITAGCTLGDQDKHPTFLLLESSLAAFTLPPGTGAKDSPPSAIPAAFPSPEAQGMDGHALAQAEMRCNEKRQAATKAMRRAIGKDQRGFGGARMAFGKIAVPALGPVTFVFSSSQSQGLDQRTRLLGTRLSAKGQLEPTTMLHKVPARPCAAEALRLLKAFRPPASLPRWQHPPPHLQPWSRYALTRTSAVDSLCDALRATGYATPQNREGPQLYEGDDARDAVMLLGYEKDPAALLPPTAGASQVRP